MKLENPQDECRLHAIKSKTGNRRSFGAANRKFIFSADGSDPKRNMHVTL